ncbi:VOC family protein [Flagellimonas lutimaris]|nr:VOC family protein [Allomuricauda lutimaris]
MKNILIGIFVSSILICCQRVDNSGNVNHGIIEDAVQFRIARPTNQLVEIKKFYTEALGMKVLGSFSDHDGYSGLMLGMPNSKYHLEFTEHEIKEHLPKPTKENLLVLYFDTPEKYDAANRQLLEFGVKPVEPENPYWIGKSKTYEDPDKWRIVLFNGVYQSN